jgi:hypothetical protein
MRQQEAGISDAGQQAAYPSLVRRMEEPVCRRLQVFCHFRQDAPEKSAAAVTSHELTGPGA